MRLLLLTRLQADTVALAPDGPNIVRARTWLDDGLAILGRPPAAPTADQESRG